MCLVQLSWGHYNGFFLVLYMHTILLQGSFFSHCMLTSYISCRYRQFCLTNLATPVASGLVFFKAFAARTAPTLTYCDRAPKIIVLVWCSLNTILLAIGSSCVLASRCFMLELHRYCFLSIKGSTCTCFQTT